MQKQLGFVKNYPHPPAPLSVKRRGGENDCDAIKKSPLSTVWRGAEGEEKEEKFGSLPTVYLHLQKK